jgi:hypothetical protein
MMMLQAVWLAAELTLAPPHPVAPPDDPRFEACLQPQESVLLRWDGERQDGATTWLLIKRRDPNTDNWQTWVKSYVRSPPFTLNMRSHAARNGDFSWTLMSIDPGTEEVRAGEWSYFCTRE